MESFENDGRFSRSFGVPHSEYIKPVASKRIK